MKKTIAAVIAFFILSVPSLHADPPEDWATTLIDTTIYVEGLPYRVQRITSDEFRQLYNKHYIKPSKPVRKMEEVDRLLGKKLKFTYKTHIYDNSYTNSKDTLYSLIELRKGKEFRFLFNIECGGFTAYYPRERIIVYEGGHCSEYAIFVDNGEPAYNPESSAVSPHDKRYRVGGLFSGQENIDYSIERYNAKTKRYQQLCYLYEIAANIPSEAIGYTFYVSDSFIVGNTYYFCTGNYEEGDEENNWWLWKKYIAITLPE